MPSDSVQHQLLAERVAEAPPEVAARGPTVLNGFVRSGFESAASLDFTEDDDIYRLMVLPLVLSPAQRESAMLHGLIVRALDQTRWSPTHRLDFIYMHVVPRSPSPTSEVELAPLYSPPEVNDDATRQD